MKSCNIYRIRLSGTGASSVYIYIIFINELFKHLRNIYGVNYILGTIHNLIHADNTILLGTNYTVLKSKIISTISSFNDIDQTLNLATKKNMCIKYVYKQHKN